MNWILNTSCAASYASGNYAATQTNILTDGERKRLTLNRHARELNKRQRETDNRQTDTQTDRRQREARTTYVTYGREERERGETVTAGAVCMCV